MRKLQSCISMAAQEPGRSGRDGAHPAFGRSRDGGRPGEPMLFWSTPAALSSAKAEAIENVWRPAFWQQNGLKVIVTGWPSVTTSQIGEEIPRWTLWWAVPQQGHDSIVARLFQGREPSGSYGAKKDFPLGGKRASSAHACHYAYLRSQRAAATAATTRHPSIRGPLHNRDLAGCVAGPTGSR